MPEKESRYFQGEEIIPEIKGEKDVEQKKEETEIRESVFENAPEEREIINEKPEKAPEEKESTGEKLEKLKEQFQELRQKIEEEKERERAPFKDFEKYFVSHNKIELPEEKEKELEKQVSDLQKRDTFKGPRIFTGNKTAAEYDNQWGNFSTNTAIVKLSSGEKIFAVDCYPASLIHRMVDGSMRVLTDASCFKVDNKVWKEIYEKRSNIPTIKVSSGRAIAMPYIENVNLFDLMFVNKKVKNWGTFDWARNITLEDKKEIAAKMIQELKKVHQQNKTWGEALIHNMIIDKNKKVWICDPETVYLKSIPFSRQKALDIYDMICSVSGALAQSENFSDFKEIAKLIIDNYQDDSIVKKVKGVAEKKLSLRQKLFYFFIKARYNFKNRKMHQEVNEAIAKYGEKE